MFPGRTPGPPLWVLASTNFFEFQTLTIVNFPVICVYLYIYVCVCVCVSEKDESVCVGGGGE